MLLLESCRQSHICLQRLYCEKSCMASFTAGTVCKGDVGVSGSRRTESSTATCREGHVEDQTHIWTDFDTSDPDDIAIHLWTFSMGGTRRHGQRQSTATDQEGSGRDERAGRPEEPAFYKRLNMALLHDDSDELNRLAFVICGIVHWIRGKSFTPEEDIVLYRGEYVVCPNNSEVVIQPSPPPAHKSVCGVPSAVSSEQSALTTPILTCPRYAHLQGPGA